MNLEKPKPGGNYKNLAAYEQAKEQALKHFEKNILEFIKLQIILNQDRYIYPKIARFSPN